MDSTRSIEFTILQPNVRIAFPELSADDELDLRYLTTRNPYHERLEKLPPDNKLLVYWSLSEAMKTVCAPEPIGGANR